MACQKSKPLIALALFYFTLTFCDSASKPGPIHNGILPFPRPRGAKAAYWAAGNGFPASSIATSYFTHIYYAFLLPEPSTYVLNITPFDQQMLPEFTQAIASLMPRVKILLSVGGAGNDPEVFSRMASSARTRAIFINSTIEVARKYGFDGVDLDWEFPANNTDMANLGLLYKQWREFLDDEAKATEKDALLLTSAVYYSSIVPLDGVIRNYPSDAIGTYLDWINPMCYDYHGKWENFTGEHSALFDPNSTVSTNVGIESWIQSGVPSRKIALGLPLYGHTWKLQDPNVNGVGARALGAGPGAGIFTYTQIVDFNLQNNASVRFDTDYIAYYSYAGDTWIGYDDIKSIKFKVEFARSHDLGGYFFWATGLDMNWTLSSAAYHAWEQW